MAAGGNPQNVKLGPGRLYFAPLGTTEPTVGSAVLPSAWTPLGYTENGSEFGFALTNEDVEVAEELDPIDAVNTKRALTLTVEAAEATKRNLQVLTGGGAAALNDGTPFEPPTPGTEVGVMLVWDSSDTAGASGDILNRRVLMRKAVPSGNINIARRKAPAKTTLPAVLKLVKPDANNGPIKFFPDQSGRI